MGGVVTLGRVPYSRLCHSGWPYLAGPDSIRFRSRAPGGRFVPSEDSR